MRVIFFTEDKKKNMDNQSGNRKLPNNSYVYHLDDI